MGIVAKQLYISVFRYKFRQVTCIIWVVWTL